MKEYVPAQSTNLTVYKVESKKIKELVLKIYQEIDLP